MKKRIFISVLTVEITQRDTEKAKFQINKKI